MKALLFKTILAFLSIGLFLVDDLEPNVFYLSSQSTVIQLNLNSPSHSAIADSLDISIVLPNKKAKPAQSLSPQSKNRIPLDQFISQLIGHGPSDQTLVKYQPLGQMKFNTVKKLVNKNKLYAQNDFKIQDSDSFAVRKQKLIQYYSNFDWSQPTLEQKAQELVALAEIEKQEQQKVLIQAMPQKKEKPQAIIYASDLPKTKKSTQPKVIRLASYSPANKRDDGVRPTGQSSEPKAPVKASSSADTDTNRPFYLSGPIQAGFGLALAEKDNFIEVKRVFAGEVFEMGEYIHADSTYQLRVESLQGQVLAEIRSSHSGALLGVGVVELSELKVDGYVDKIENLGIQLKPIQDERSGILTDAYGEALSGKTEISLVGSTENRAEFYGKNRFRLKGISGHSSVQVSVTNEESRWGSLATVEHHNRNKIPVFNDRIVEGLIRRKYPEYKKEYDSFSIVWGRVVQNGKPVKGAVVEITDSEYKPIYFTAFVPNLEQHETGTNGEFVYILPKEGDFFVRIKLQKEGQWSYLPAKRVLAEFGFVSNIEIEFNSEKVATVDVYNPFLDEELSEDARVTLLGHNESLNLEEGKIHLPQTTGHNFYDVDIPGYRLHSFAMSARARHLDIKMIDDETLKRLAASKGIKENKNLGVVFGVIQSSGELYDVYLNNLREEANIVYFNGLGEVTAEPSDDGGFVIFNVPLGEHSLKVNVSNTEEQFTTLLGFTHPGVQVVEEGFSSL